MYQPKSTGQIDDLFIDGALAVADPLEASFRALRQRIEADPRRWNAIGICCRFEVDGEGEWIVDCRPDRGERAAPHTPNCTLVLLREECLALVRGEMNPQAALAAERIKVRGDLAAALRLNLMFEELRREPLENV